MPSPSPIDGTMRREPDPEGILAIDKPPGITSHDAVDRVRTILGMRRVGHAGTLDPPATGVLVLGVGRATRVLRFLETHEKEYQATIMLGQETTTLDAEGESTGPGRPVDVSRRELEAALARWRGEIQQTPPMVSAVRVAGVRLHRRARRGESIERPVRRVTVYSLELTSFAPPLAGLHIVCSPGTYVRVLAADLGAFLGCGAHLHRLRRTRVGRFVLAEAAPLPAVDDPEARGTLSRAFLPLAEALGHLPAWPLGEREAGAVLKGVAPPARRDGPGAAIRAGEVIRLLSPRREILGLAEWPGSEEGGEEERRVRLKCVFRPPVGSRGGAARAASPEEAD